MWAQIDSIARHEGESVTLKGWVYNKRSKGKLQFLLVRDGTGLIQCVVSQGEVTPDSFAAAQSLTQESSVIVRGFVRKDARAPGGYELTVASVEPVQVAVDYPISPKEHGVDFLMNNRHLWLRSSRQYAILRTRAGIIRAIRGYLDDNGFVLVDAPILTPAVCEGTTNLFETDYFGDRAYLSQSGQLYVEAGAMALGKVYCFGPTFRAEKSKTRRHLMEFWMVEPEMAYFEHEDSIKLQEDFLSYVVQTVLEAHADELKLLGRDLRLLEKVSPPFPRITYDDALAFLKGRGEDIVWGDDFGGGHETILAEQHEKPVFVERFPAQCKAFYMQPDQERPEVALCADLLAPEGYGEIIGGGQRIHDFALLEKRLEEHGLSPQAYQWYLDLRAYGSVPHSGFGLGIERTVAWICGLDHVRETIPFPRMLYRMYP